MAAIEHALRWLGALPAVALFVLALWGVSQSRGRRAGLAVGRWAGLARSPWFVLLGSVALVGVAYLLWRPLPLSLAPVPRVMALSVGVLLYFAGLGLWLWGRLTLGRMFAASTGFGVQLFAGQQLVTWVPYALVRHPMYLGLILAAWGALLLYRTWACAALAVSFLGLGRRAPLEERALAARFGPAWERYSRRVPAWLPCLRRHSRG